MRIDTDALKAIYQTVPALASKTFVSTAPHGTPLPYAVLHPSDGRDSQERVSGPRVTRHPRFTAHIFGTTGEQVQALADLVKPKLVANGRGIVLSVAGWKNKPVWYESPVPIQVDWEGPEPVAFHVAEIGWTSDPT